MALTATSFERISYTLNGCANGLFGSRAFDGEGIGRGTSLGYFYAGEIFDGTNYGSLAMTAMHVLNPIDDHIWV